MATISAHDGAPLGATAKWADCGATRFAYRRPMGSESYREEFLLTQVARLRLGGYRIRCFVSELRATCTAPIRPPANLLSAIDTS